MKLRDIFESYDLGQRGTNFSQEELETLYKVITSHKELDLSELKGITQELEEKGQWSRGDFSAKLGLARMHVLVHGVAPYGATERTAENWMQPSLRMMEFAKKKGLEADANLARAKRELSSRKPKLKREQAVQMMAAYAKENRDKITQSARANRDSILGDIQAGLTPEEAFARWS
jgi:hypothetical protein